MKSIDLQNYLGKHVLVYAQNHRICTGSLTGLHREGGKEIMTLSSTTADRKIPVSAIQYVIETPSRINYNC
ncbi:hypothetical protein FYJ51_07845 [Erysipelotrichaceae bacterium Oil+RF-744-GAM-WT-6]|jgi:hypothetical protein|uniref:Uncharacterized protein n=1 Tax=Stecheria intestinalis TaxID=2606630 RepID=A0A7X2TFK2_9FIRM|nr:MULTISPECIES: hypothetical protein [Erysipelotrichaceae]MCI2155181.1 hypothetical protein [Solobacterium sp.]MSS58819.1 hypothetical protein [Stecheria intestinalis]